MGKYEPLTEYLRRQSKDYVEMSFKEIEKIIGAKLPQSAKDHRAWWSNNEQNSAMTRAWRQARFRSTRVDLSAGKLTFVRDRPSKLDAADQKRAEKRHARSARHPLIGAMKGTVWIAPGTDLTQPAMPEWGEVAYGDKTWDDFK